MEGGITMTREDSIDVLDRIRAEIEQIKSIMNEERKHIDINSLENHITLMNLIKIIKIRPINAEK